MRINKPDEYKVSGKQRLYGYPPTPRKKINTISIDVFYFSEIESLE